MLTEIAKVVLAFLSNTEKKLKGYTDTTLETALENIPTYFRSSVKNGELIVREVKTSSATNMELNITTYEEEITA